jgi:hypothetical protein
MATKKTNDGYYSGKQTPIDWHALDWTKRDVIIAMQIGRSAAWIRAKRKELGKQKPTEAARPRFGVPSMRRRQVC